MPLASVVNILPEGSAGQEAHGDSPIPSLSLGPGPDTISRFRIFMKITARITMGFGILMAMLLLLAAGQVMVVRRMRALSNETGDSLQSALASLLLLRECVLIHRNAELLFAQAEEGARSELELHRDTFAGALQELTGGRRSEVERREIERLDKFWEQFAEELAREMARPPRRPGGATPQALSEHLDRLETQTRTVYAASISAVTAQSEQVRVTNRQWERFSWTMAVAALVLGGLIAILITRSVSIPLSSLAEGARALAEGKSFVRLDTSRKDELAQIAKDFNTLMDQLGQGSRKG